MKTPYSPETEEVQDWRTAPLSDGRPFVPQSESDWRTTPVVQQQEQHEQDALLDAIRKPRKQRLPDLPEIPELVAGTFDQFRELVVALSRQLSGLDQRVYELETQMEEVLAFVNTNSV